MYVYIQSETWPSNLWTVGFYCPEGNWHPESDWSGKEEAANRVAYLNGQQAVNRALDEALNSGDGSYKP